MKELNQSENIFLYAEKYTEILILLHTSTRTKPASSHRRGWNKYFLPTETVLWPQHFKHISLWMTFMPPTLRTLYKNPGVQTCSTMSCCLLESSLSWSYDLMFLLTCVMSLGHKLLTLQCEKQQFRLSYLELYPVWSWESQGQRLHNLPGNPNHATTMM